MIFSKPIRLSGHAQQQIAYRGASVSEIEEAIRSAKGSPPPMAV
jgi:hypothetical protein